MQLPGTDDVRAAAGRIAGKVHRTPVLTSETFDRLVGARLYWKAENFQKGGAFKARGAANAVSLLTEAQLTNGVATHSSGNHAQALALAARSIGIRAYIVMPVGSPQAKRAAVEGYGARVVECANTLAAREEALERVVRETGAHFVHPYDDPGVIAGQGTAALELLEAHEDIDVIVVPVGGGGLASGTVLAAGGRQVVGVEPELADDAARSLRAGRRLDPRPPVTIADGLRTGLSDRTFAILSAYAVLIVTVSEEQILAAMRLIWERMKIIVEPSGAVPAAAVLANVDAFAGKNVGVILSGGNVDLCQNPHCNFWR